MEGKIEKAMIGKYVSQTRAQGKCPQLPTCKNVPGSTEPWFYYYFVVVVVLESLTNQNEVT